MLRRWAFATWIIFLALASAPGRAQRQPAEAANGMVASAHALASAAGIEVLEAGGNAADAAVATALALAVVYPRAGNLGGGGFAVLHLAAGTDHAIDFRERAPAAATPQVFLDASGAADPGRSMVGHLASGVPGTVAGLALIHGKFGSGRFSWARLVEPAARLASRGFMVTPALARDLEASVALLERFPASRRIFLRNGRPFRVGEVLRQPELARTLRRLARDGPGDFYLGATARLIVAEMARHGGLVSAGDLAAYRPVERVPLRGRYREHEVVTMPPPSSGGVALLQMLGMLESHDVAALGLSSAAKIHLFAEVMRRAFQDRARFLGDPDFVDVPVERLLDRAYLQARMQDYRPDSASRDAGRIASTAPGGESAETTHLSIVDAAGNAVSLTYTLNGLFGSGVTVGGAGFLLNNEMDDFTVQAGVRNAYGLVQGKANLVAAGKRPLSSMTPTIVLRQGRPFLVTGSPGGPTIINTVLLVLTNVIDHGLTVTQAVDAPRFHHQWSPDRIEHEPFLASPDTLGLLRERGHALALRTLYPNAPEAQARYWGDAETILVEPGTARRLGANDLRSPDSAVLGW